MYSEMSQIQLPWLVAILMQIQNKNSYFSKWPQLEYHIKYVISKEIKKNVLNNCIPNRTLPLAIVTTKKIERVRII